MGILEILETLANTSSINARKALLKEHAKNQQLKTFFDWCVTSKKYGCHKTYHLIESKKSHTTDISRVTNILQRLVESKKGIDGYMEKELPELNHEERELLHRCLAHDPRCNVSSALLNETWPKEVVPEKFVAKLCKAEPYSKTLIEKQIHFPAIIQTKMDGARCLIYVEINEDKIIVHDPISSSSKPFLKLNALKEDIEKATRNFIAKYDISESFVIDGELLVSDGEKIAERKIGNGILNKSLHNTISETEQSNVFFVAWDYIDWSAYQKGVETTIYDVRMTKLRLFCKESNKVKCVQYKIVHSIEDALKFYQSMLEDGQEGAILKNVDNLWKPKRLKDQIKMKMAVETTLKVVDVLPGGKNTKYENCMGRVICESSDGKIRVSVGSGWSDEDRMNWVDPNWERPNFIEVMSNAVIEDANGYSLFLPRFTGERRDKTEADDFETIKKLFAGAIPMVTK